MLSLGPVMPWQAAAIVGAVVAFVICALVAVGLAMRRSRLNWYEKNLLEISECHPNVIRYKRPGSIDLDDSEQPRKLYKLKRTSSTPGCSYEQIGERDWEAAKKKSGFQLEKLENMPPAKFYVPPLYNNPVVMISQPSNESIATQPAAAAARSSTATSMFRQLTKNQIDRSLYESRQDSITSSYSGDEVVLGQCGSLNMGLRFDTEFGILGVKLLRAQDLAAKRTDGLPNPFFKIRLVKPGSPTHLFHQSRTCTDTRSPELGDEFSFDAAPEVLLQSRLEIFVYDHDPATVDECIGYCSILTSGLDYPTGLDSYAVIWAEILPPPEETNEAENYAGDLLFRVAFLHAAQRLTVTVIKARNLYGPDGQPPDPCVRVGIVFEGKRIKRKTTASKKATYNPHFNEALTFAIPKASVCGLTLEFDVIHDRGLLAGRGIGHLQLQLHKCKEMWKGLLSGENSAPRWYRLEKMTDVRRPSTVTWEK